MLAATGCSSGDSGTSGATEPSDTPSSPTKTLTLAPPSEEPLSGTLTAELQQSSRDVALGRFQVWITNGLDHEIKPKRIVYRDVQLSGACSATGGTTVFVNLTVVRRNSKDLKVQVRLAMSPEVTAETFAYAADACGWEEE
ncbi:MAG: hypothetical protein ABWZ91_02515 [Nocardioides sp.]